jgi:hypothetical protein
MKREYKCAVIAVMLAEQVKLFEALRDKFTRG